MTQALNRNSSSGLGGQAIIEYLMIFALLAFIVTLGSVFFQDVMTNMDRARNTGIDWIVNHR